ncbi:MAG: RloB domain-containing protein [Sphaerochaetaceae bacterium]|nr:RloB domain-containing protein [Sphaerochaetaceae bacterium]
MKRKRNIKSPLKTMLIYTASKVEQVYFGQVRKDCRYTNMTVKSVKELKDFPNFISQAGRERTKGSYSSVWAFFGFSDFENFDPKELEENLKLAKKKKIHLCWIKPNLNLWIYLHLALPTTYVLEDSSFEQQLEKAISGYSLTSEYLSGKGQNLHLVLFSKFSKAILNEKQYNIISRQKTGIPATNIDKLYLEIHDICGNGDITHNQKTLSKK